MSASDDDFEAPESASWRKFVRHVADAMPVHVVAACALVAFLFFHGMAGSLLRLAGRSPAPVGFPMETVCGAFGGLVCTGLILRIKYRKK